MEVETKMVIDKILGRLVRVAFSDDFKVSIRQGFLTAIDDNYAVIFDPKRKIKHIIPRSRIVRIEVDVNNEG